MTKLSAIDLPDSAGVYGDELPPGTSLCNDQYVVENYINCGGFGIAYQARDSLGRKVVIKECFPNAICRRKGEHVGLRSRSYEVDFDRAVDLFQKEAHALAQLDHPNIVGVHQIFQANGTAYMALDFVEGTDLLDLMDCHPEVRAPAAIRELSLILLDALNYVHTHGILHRDISPDNILLDRAGTPVLIDFGAARQNATQQSRILSRVYTVKDGYSPQEFYIPGSEQSPSSDLYALAATFYHLIVGDPPPNSSLRLAAVTEDKPDPYTPLEGRFPAFDPALLSSIDTCMSLFARDRLQTAKAWLDIITGTPRVSPNVVVSKDDDLIRRRVAELVRENRKAIAARKEEVREEPEIDKLKAAREAEELARRRAHWAILNEDPADWEAEDEEPSGAEVAPVQVRRPVSSDTHRSHARASSRPVAEPQKDVVPEPDAPLLAPTTADTFAFIGQSNAPCVPTEEPEQAPRLAPLAADTSAVMPDASGSPDRAATRPQPVAASPDRARAQSRGFSMSDLVTRLVGKPRGRIDNNV